MKIHTVPLTGTTVADVEATPEQLFAVAADPVRVGEWSHECVKARWMGGCSKPEVGARFRGYNRVGQWRRWNKRVEFTRVDGPHLVEWKALVWRGRWTGETLWTLQFTPLSDGRARVEQRFQILRPSPIISVLYAQFLVKEHRDRSGALNGDLIRLGQVASHE